MEFYALPDVRAATLPMLRELIAVSGATGIEAQTNIPLMLLMLLDCAQNIIAETILFEDARTTPLECPNGALTRVSPEDAGRISEGLLELGKKWVGIHLFSCAGCCS